VTDSERLAAMRHDYVSEGLCEEDLAPTWLEQLRRWLADAHEGGMREANAMVLSTADAQCRVHSRTVLLKGLDARGLTFFTNYDSQKGRDVRENPHASALFPWIALQRQVIVTGTVERIAAGESDAYFASRPHGSQLGALTSPQSQVIEGREELDARFAALAGHYPEGSPVPRPPNWGGLRLVPDTVELWQGRSDRLHDRLRYRREGDAWVVERLAP
jgi:pyridoxamine 5'-phosphate oxidase